MGIYEGGWLNDLKNNRGNMMFNMGITMKGRVQLDLSKKKCDEI
jgi:hypothetical protein